MSFNTWCPELIKKLLSMPMKESFNQYSKDKEDLYMSWWLDLGDKNLEIIMINMSNELEGQNYWKKAWTEIKNPTYGFKNRLYTRD